MKKKFTEKTEVLNIRVSQELKDKLKTLVDKKRFGSNSSEVVRYLIEYHYRN